MAAEHVLHMQKALDQMNLQIHRVLNDITALSGLRKSDRQPYLFVPGCFPSSLALGTKSG
jgi:hypothetical protein